MNQRLPKLFNLRSDSFERADESFDCSRWRVDRAFALVPAQAFVARWLSTFKEFPPLSSPNPGAGRACCDNGRLPPSPRRR